MKVLTQRERKVRDFIVATQKERGYPPSTLEIANEFDISTSTAHKDLWELHNKGHIVKGEGSRAITILEAS